MSYNQAILAVCDSGMKNIGTKLTLKNNDIRRFASDSTLNFIRIMFDNAEGAREGENIEALHDMRVASRRLRECFQIFQSFYATKKLAKIVSRVKEVTRILGIPREMDVNVSLLKTYKPRRSLLLRTTYEYLREIFEFEQRRHHKKMRKDFDKLDLRTLESDLIQFAKTALTKSPNSHLLADTDQHAELEAFLPQTIQILREKAAPILAFQSFPFPSASQASDDEALHRLRIQVKKFRYCLEILNPLHASRFEKGIELAKELQEVLGKIHDLVVLTGRLNIHRVHLMERSRAYLTRGCQQIVGDLGELKASLLPRVDPAHKAFVDELCQLLPLETKSPVLDPRPMKIEKSGQETLDVERPSATSTPGRRSDLLTSTQSAEQEKASAKSGAGGA